MCEKDWTDLLSALLTPVLALVAIFIAVLQWKINRNRLKHELFDRRYEQYKAVTSFLNSILRNGEATTDAQQDFLSGTVGMEFTFSKEITDYLHQKIWVPAINLETAQSQFTDLPIGDERSRLVHEAADLKIQLYKELNEIDNVFRPYLHLSH